MRTHSPIPLIATALLPEQAALLHELYLAVPGYFELLGCRVPHLAEVRADLQTAQADPRRHIELLHDAQGRLVGSLDYKTDYPAAGDLTINLLLIRQEYQGRGLGEQAVRDLEKRVPATTRRILASVLGENPRGVRFWERLGYHFALDARPALCWYAKEVGQAPSLPSNLLPTAPLHPAKLSRRAALGVASD